MTFAAARPMATAGFYDLPSDLGTAFEVVFGRNFGEVRVEVSVSQRSNNIEQEFTDITFLDGSPILPNEDSNYTSTNTTRVDALAARTLSLNAYHDFAFAESRVMLYLGAGLGLSFVKLSGLYFSSEYSCISQPCGGRPAAEYNSLQDVDLSDSGLFQAALCRHRLSSGRQAPTRPEGVLQLGRRSCGHESLRGASVSHNERHRNQSHQSLVYDARLQVPAQRLRDRPDGY